MFVCKSRHAPELLSGANYYAKLSYSKQLLKKYSEGRNQDLNKSFFTVCCPNTFTFFASSVTLIFTKFHWRSTRTTIGTWMAHVRIWIIVPS